MNPISCSQRQQSNNPSSISGFRKAAAAWVDLVPIGSGDDGGDCAVGCKTVSAKLLPGKPYTIGRSKVADFVINDVHVSKQHCQILFDGFLKKLYLLNGVLLINCNCVVHDICSIENMYNVDSFSNCVVSEFRSRLIGEDFKVEGKCRYVYKSCLNGVFVNGGRVRQGSVVELCVGDQILLVCDNEKGVCGGFKSRIGFVVRRAVLHEELVEPGCESLWFEEPRLERPVLCGKVKKRVFALRVSDSKSWSSECGEVVGRAKSLSAHCNRIAHSSDPISCIRQIPIGGPCSNKSKRRKIQNFELDGNVDLPRNSVPQDNVFPLRQQPFGTSTALDVERSRAPLVQSTDVADSCDVVVPLIPRVENLCPDGYNQNKVSGYELNGNVNLPKESLHQDRVVIVRQQTCETLVPPHGNESSTIAGIHSISVKLSSDAMVLPKPRSDNLSSEWCAGAAFSGRIDHKSADLNSIDGKNSFNCNGVSQKGPQKKICAPGKNFYLNRLEGIDQCSSGQDNVVSLPELLHPVDSISRMFIATLTCDIGWFLSYCDIPFHLPVTIACHNTEKCWSADPGNRSYVPDPDFPNLVVVYPPFPESIAFGQDRNKKGVACHHPKLFVLQREDSVRVIITSANLVAKQWKSVTNTVWWQDFPRRDYPDCLSLFDQLNQGNLKSHSPSDFAAQLAGFMASLLTDVPSQAYWIFELAKYDFTRANVYLVASVPGIHSYRSIRASESIFESKGSERLLGSVGASVVGLSHRFQRAVDPNGAQLKKLATYLGHSSVQRCGMSKVVLRREKYVPQDTNAVSVHVSSPTELCHGDYVQLGFLPRTVARWVSPLWDIGYFTFHGYVYSQEALAAASGESNIRVQLVLCVTQSGLMYSAVQGPKNQKITKMMEPEHVAAFCSLVASLQRCTGIWRLEEVLNQYKWPEYMESDFVYGSSSIGGSVGVQFLAAFSAAAGKRSQQAYDSQESDPEWGCWNADHEMKNPSIKILFPTIERVKSSQCGILPSKHILSLTEKTWQKVKNLGILHDAIPHPSSRVGHPMHVKVARRRFKSKTEESSCGWVYCGSHNLSAAAWGRVISSQSEGQASGRDKSSNSCSRLHVCNYELGIISVFPQAELKNSSLDNLPKLDDIKLPFVVPAPKYGPRDKPATVRAMWEALAQVAEQEGSALTDLAAKEEIAEDDVDEEEALNYVAQEAEEEKAYADVLWHHVDSSQSS